MNTHYSFILATIISVAITACQVDTITEDKDTSVTDELSNDAAVSGIMRIKVTEELALEWLSHCNEEGLVMEYDEDIFPDINVTSIITTFHIGGRFEKTQKEAGLHKWFDITYEETTRPANVTKSLESNAHVLISEPVYKPVLSSVEMNDPLFSEYQWHYCNTGEYEFKPGIDMGLTAAWEQFGVFGNKEVIVAVVDSGVEYTHEDLSPNMWVNEAELNGIEGVDDDGNGYKDDIYGYNFSGNSAVINFDSHGTHVAGTIAAANNNGIGVCGIAGGYYPDIPGVRIMTLQVLDDKYPNASYSLLRVYQYAAENGATILNNSWGYEQTFKNMPNADKEAIDYFNKYAGLDENGNQVGPMKGGLAIFAAGNEAEDLSYPAAYEGVIAVAAIGPKGKASYYTNYGEWVDVCAPGGDHKVDSKYGGIYSTGLNNSYVTMQGTSMACPHVTGIAALVLSASGGPGYTSEDLKEAILNSADPFIYEYNQDMEGLLGKGMVNAALAMSSLNTTPPENVTLLSGESNANTIYLIADVPADDNGDAYYYHVYISTEEIQLDALDECMKFDVVINKQESTSDGRKRFAIQGLEFETTYNIAVFAGDYAGNMSASPCMTEITTKANTLPEITATTEGKNELMPSESTIYVFYVRDADDFHTITCSFDEGNTSDVNFDRLQDGSYYIKIDASTMSEGDYKCWFIATDQYGGKSKYEISFTIKANNAPEITKAIEDQILNGTDDSHTIDLNTYFTDEDADKLTFTASTDNNDVLSVSINGSKLTLTAKSAGYATVSVTAKDGSEATASTDFSVCVRNEDASPYEIYPNPVIDIMNIRSFEEENVEITIYSSTGQKIISENTPISWKDTYTVDLSEQAPGMYSVLIVSEDGRRFQTSIAKL